MCKLRARDIRRKHRVGGFGHAMPNLLATKHGSYYASRQTRQLAGEKEKEESIIKIKINHSYDIPGIN